MNTGSDQNQPPQNPRGNQQGEVPPAQAPVVSLSPPSGGGAKPWIIMLILVALVGLGLWAISAMGGKDGDQGNDAEKEKVEEPKKKRAKPRVAEKTTPRPSKSEMANLSSKNPGAYERNAGKWVILKGEVGIGDKDGVVVFKEPSGMRGQLLKGTADHLSGKLVKIIGWMVSKEKIQIEGIYDIEFIDPLDLLPKKDVYTKKDAGQLVALRHSKATFKGKVEKVRISWDKENYHLVFENEGGHEIFGTGNVEKLGENEITEELLKELVGKTIKLTGKLGFKVVKEKERVTIEFSNKDAYEIVE